MQRPLRILLLQGSAPDAQLIPEAMAQLPIQAELLVAHSAQEADAALQRAIDLILLDADLPPQGGLEWLRDFKAQHPHGRLPVIMLLRPNDDLTVREAYRQYASDCLINPAEPSELRRMLSALLDYWSNVARLPRRWPLDNVR